MTALSYLHGAVRCFDKGEILFQEEDHIETIAIVLEGEIALENVMINGKEILFQKLLPGYLLGADIASTPLRKSVYRARCTKDTMLFRFSFDRLEHEDIPYGIRKIMYRNLFQLIANENARKFRRIYMMSIRRVRERIMSYLLWQMEKNGSEVFSIPMNREQMANFLNINKTVLSHELSLLEQEGIIQFRKNVFRILQSDKKN